jgi:methylaspartate mutase epsilon subunit
VLEMGNGDIVIGSIKAVKDGVLDSAMSPNIHVRDQVLGAKDSTGAVRYVEFGNLPMPDEVKDFHRRKLASREKSEQRKIDYTVMVKDLWAFSKGELIGGKA